MERAGKNRLSQKATEILSIALSCEHLALPALESASMVFIALESVFVNGLPTLHITIRLANRVKRKWKDMSDLKGPLFT